jgi:hypothetical protein
VQLTAHRVAGRQGRFRPAATSALKGPTDASKAARDSIGMRPLRWHDLRHTFGSLLVAGSVDLVSGKAGSPILRSAQLPATGPVARR